MIEPVIDAFTTSISPAWSAKKAMISSAMLPNVAFRMPPTCGPVGEPRRSVESPTTQARPRIPVADTRNRTVSSTCRAEVQDDRDQADDHGPEQEGTADRRELAQDREARPGDEGPGDDAAVTGQILAQREAASCRSPGVT